MFRTVLIANRGEIALRIIRACREPRRATPSWLTPRPTATRPGWTRPTRPSASAPARADRSYLNADAILQAAEQTDCQAIHPGYGFLAENALFAARCEQQGITFIGPTARSIRRMGDKAERQAHDGRGRACRRFPAPTARLAGLDEAREIAAAGRLPGAAQGVGRRRRQGHAPLRRPRACSRRRSQQASLEAEKAFGDPSLYLEKLITGGRHIEFQILCDAFGNAVHLGERECSIQRKHQKLVEESPSPVVGRRGRDAHLGDHGRAGRGARRLSQRGHGRVPARPGGNVLLHGDEHPTAGRTPGDRDDHRNRSRGRATPHRGQRAADTARRTPSSSPATRSSFGSTPRIPDRGLPARPGQDPIVHSAGGRTRRCPGSLGLGDSRRLQDPAALRLDGGQADRSRSGPRGGAPRQRGRLSSRSVSRGCARPSRSTCVCWPTPAFREGRYDIDFLASGDADR